MTILLILAIGITLTAYGLHAKWKYAQEKWQSTEAKVISNKALKHTSRYGDFYTPYVQYSYQVNKKTYLGNSYAFSLSEDRGDIEAVTLILKTHYDEGSNICIWHQINAPSISCIKLKSSYSRSEMSALIVAGILVLSLGLTALINNYF